ncbi:MAG: NTP transferase domain-containing protein [Anaerolineae bacterium]|nr:NTP transferase domain-containing protein [Anaerolineae bacterium]
MKIIIPLAGYGTRLRPHTYTRPKPLIDVAGKPALGHLLDKLSLLPGVTEYIFIVGYLGEQIEEYVQKHYQIPARYLEQKELLGQSHAIALARNFVGDEPVFVVFVDTIFEADLSILTRTEADGLIFVHEVDDPRRFGVVMLNAQGHIIRMVEKAEEPPSNLAIVGMYYVRDGRRLMEAFDWQLSAEENKTKGEYYIADALQYLVNQGAVFKTAPVSQWLDVGVPATVLSTNRYLLNQGGMDNSASLIQHYKTAIIIPPVHIHPSAVIERSVIGPDVSVAAGCVVKDSIVRNSIIGEGSQIQDAMLQESLIGKNAFVAGRYRAYNVGDSSMVGFAEIQSNT